eukprot:CAMPEP_0195281138 /NCGR_PEP_ID=MMETSP0707-20130614/580_1 /TAXON_ID=33640 /ORGANISM="Asterionellopsis glacialis, Strain CCMP134" /LENGTH=301 /DNA_ID=CAMNT_0040339991 /DNA_START=6 /DNA_END=911 /DNA_ORIENTATION=-
MENDGDILCTAKWLNDNLDNVKVIDVHWQWEGSEFSKTRIPSARFFDMTLISDQNSPYKYMLPPADYFALQMNKMGIHNTDHLVIYDSIHGYPSCRVYWMFKTFGHHGKVTILNGGYDAWKAGSYTILSDPLDSPPESYENNNKVSSHPYKATLRPENIVSYEDIVKNVELFRSGENGTLMMDARKAESYNKGHIPYAVSATWSTFTTEYQSDDNNNNNTFKGFADVDVLEERLRVLQVPLDKDKPVITSCQSGISGVFLYVVLHLVKTKRNGGMGQISLYDGSFGEYSKRSTDIAVISGS